MIYRGRSHQETFERELLARPEHCNRMVSGLYLLTADTGLWSQVRDSVSIRNIFVEEMRPKHLSAPGYLFFSAAKDVVTGSKTISLTDIADPALLSQQTFLVLTTALMIRAYGLSAAKRLSA